MHKFTLIALALALAGEAGWGMKYITVCKSRKDCKQFSRLVMGTDHLVQGGWTNDQQKEPTKQTAFEVLDEAAKLGINFFDTSPIYVGGVENKLGEWKRNASKLVTQDSFYYPSNDKLNPDRKLYILSKGGFPFDLFYSRQLEAGTHSPELKGELERRKLLLSPDAHGRIPLKEAPAGTYASRLYGEKEQITKRVSEEMSHTLKNLDSDVTVYLMHRDDGDAVDFHEVPREKNAVLTILQGLAPAEVSGKFWALGWSNWKTERVNKSLELSDENARLPRPMFNSPYFSLFEMNETAGTIHALGVQVTHREMMEPEFQNGILIMPYSPLGGFSILDKPEPQWENAKAAAFKKFQDKDPYWRNVYQAIFTPQNEARWHRVVEFTKRFNSERGTSYTVDQMMNAYVLAHPRTDLLAIGAITKEQIQRSVAALELSEKLTARNLEYLYNGTP